MSQELVYLLLIFGLLVVPRALQRFKVPAPLTCLVFGIAAMLWLGDRTHDPVIALLATLGISSLFLFAGLEVDLHALRRGMWPLLAHLVIRTGTLFGVGWLAWRYAGLPWQAAGLLALKGHKAVGGVRASLYNALPVEAAQALVDFMRDFQQRNG